MKASFNFSLITSLVARHIEKVVLGLACLFALFLVYGGIAKSGGLDWEPSKLETESASAETELVGRDVKIVTDWEDRAERLHVALAISKRKVENLPYDHEKNWSVSPFDESTKRDVPLLFAVQDLRATSGCGAVQMISPDKAKSASREPVPVRGGTLGQRWVVLTAAIPVAKQQEAYAEAFKDSYRDPAKDVPSYIYYRVERAEVDASGSATELQWTRLTVGFSKGGALETTQYWTGQQPEIIDRRFLLAPIDIPMAFPLPPVTNRQWGPEIAHGPDIPFYYEAKLTPETEEPSGVDPSDEPKVDEPGTMRPGGRPGYRGRPGSGMMVPGMPGMEMEENMGMEMMGSGMPGSYGGLRPGMRRGGEPITVSLFRFFDFTVVPGKHYRYRVRLLLANPNQDVPPEHLARAELRKVKYLETEFCDPADVVTVPLDSRLLCVDVKSSVNLSVEPTSHMMSIRFDPEMGDESAAEHKKLYRGQLANFFEIPLETASDKAGGPLDYGMMMGGEEGGMDMMDMMGGMEPGRRPADKGRRPKRDKEPEEAVETVDHLTRHIVLDFHGGQRMDRELTRPCSVLLLDPSGQLVVHSDLDDLEEYLTYHVPEEKPREKPEEGMMEGMEGMMMEPGMMEE